MPVNSTAYRDGERCGIVVSRPSGAKRVDRGKECRHDILSPTWTHLAKEGFEPARAERISVPIRSSGGVRETIGIHQERVSRQYRQMLGAERDVIEVSRISTVSVMNTLGSP